MKKRFDLSAIPPGINVRSTIKKCLDFMNAHPDEPTPYLVMDKDRIARKARLIGRNIRRAEVYYAVKANTHPEILAMLHGMGLGFEIASGGELRGLLELGVPPEKIISSNPMKTEKFIAEAASAGVTHFSFDSRDEIDKLARLHPSCGVYIRLTVPNEGSEWPLSRKFGVETEEALALLIYAREKGIRPLGITFHVGSQCTNPYNWDMALSKAARLWEMARDAGLELSILNLGGGYPIRYTKDVAEIETIERRVDEQLARLFPPDIRIFIEPGRGMVGDAGIFVTSVHGTACRIDENWMYVDVGVFNGLMEGVGGIRYTWLSESSGPVTGQMKEWTLSGPSCDSFDVIDKGVRLPHPEVGDRMLVLGCGAYTTCYASEFNGFSIPKTILL
ncbi:MAG: type III PLP-dependent enzyme [Nitrospirae bacterium]|nr:type III PLP-dependent enzyme [Nitrospirota bacterium]